MSKGGKYAGNTSNNKRRSANSNKNKQHRNNTQKPRQPKNQTAAENEPLKLKKSTMPELQYEKPIQDAPKPNIIPEDDPIIKETANDIGLTVEEIIKETQTAPTSPPVYIHQSNGSTTANAVEYKNPRRQKEATAQNVVVENNSVFEEPKATPTPKSESTRPRRKSTNSKKRKRRKPRTVKSDNTVSQFFEVYDAEASYKQAERDGVIAALYCLVFIGIITGFYAIVSYVFPVISVDHMADKLIEWVFMACVGEGPIADILNFFLYIVGSICKWIFSLPFFNIF